jgi:hypothetical protein
MAGQPERALTGYDVLLLSVLVEAQAGAQPTETAGACPLRGFRTATVLSSSGAATQLAATGALLSGAAGLADKVLDDDVVRAARGATRRTAERLRVKGIALADRCGLDPSAVLGAPVRAAAAEAESAPQLARLLQPTGEAVASLFAQTAVVAERPENVDALVAAGHAFGRLIHLLDAVADVAVDSRAGRFNPLLATATPATTAHELANRLQREVREAIGRVEMRDRELADALFSALPAAVLRAFPVPAEATTPDPLPRQRTAAGAGAPLAATFAAWSVASTAVFGGWGRRGGWGGGGYGPSPGYGYGYGRRRYRRGPGCCDLLACNCCANAACDGCCGDGCCCVC